MQQDETSQRDATNPGPLLAPAALDVWLRERLGRQMVVAVVAAGAQPESALARIEQGVGRYGEVRLLGRIVTLDRDDAQLAALIAALAPLDPDAMLIVSTTITDATRQWDVRALAACERAGLRDRAFVALLAPGEGMRAQARALGFEDGFALDVPLATLLAALAREAVAHDELHQRGSSPPCYL
ncbi:MAG TPA: hypothetical protein VKC57_08200 [Ktedonobacterales bacterium]|nr:hypothetical protein [Ktedonobacterales bacterium]